MRRGLALALAVLLAGCGSSDDGEPAFPPVAPAVSDWAGAVESSQAVLDRCTRRLVPGRGIATACSRSALADERRAEDRVTRALDRAVEATPRCETPAGELAGEIADVRTAQHNLITFADRVAAGKPRTGPPGIVVERKAKREVAQSMRRAREVAKAIDRGCA